MALAVARKTGKRIGLDTSTRMAINAVSAPDRDGPSLPRSEDREAHIPSSETSPVDELKRLLDQSRPFRIQFVSVEPENGLMTLGEVEIEVSDVSSAIIAAAGLTWPRNTTGLRILDHEGREVFGRQKVARK